MVDVTLFIVIFLIVSVFTKFDLWPYVFAAFGLYWLWKRLRGFKDDDECDEE